MKKTINKEIKFILISFLVFVGINVVDVLYNFFYLTPDLGKGNQTSNILTCTSWHGSFGCDISTFLNQWIFLKVLIGIPISLFITAVLFIIIDHFKKTKK